MTAKEYKKKSRKDARKVGTIYHSKRGTKLAVDTEGAIGWLQESLNPLKGKKMEYRNGVWTDPSYDPEKAQNSFDLACEMGGRSEALRGGNY